MLVNGNAVLEKALKEGYAVPAYNINNLEWTRYILEACQEDKSPVILAVTEKSIDYFGGVNVVHNVVKSLINSLNITIPVVLHLDHGKSISICKRAIDSGFTSVMLDASEKSFEENVRDTNDVIEYAKEKSVSVEAEIGSMNKEEGKNFSEILNCIRIRHAKELMKEPAYRLADIAELVGFTDVTHFSRVFKKNEGISANEYRNTKL